MGSLLLLSSLLFSEMYPRILTLSSKNMYIRKVILLKVSVLLFNLNAGDRTAALVF